MRSLLLVPMILCWVYPATAQIEHGSVGVVYFTKYEISVAADSRGTVKDNSIPPDDTVCKIAALGGNVIFVLTGVTRYPRTGSQFLDNAGEARIAYGNVVSRFGTSVGHVDSIADEWKRSMVEKLNVIAQFHPADFANAVTPAGRIADVMIGGTDASGGLVLYGISITTTLPVTVESRAVGWSGQIDCHLHHGFCGIGSSEIVTEFADQTSKRAKREAAEWRRRGKRQYPGGVGMAKTRRMVELTIAHHVGNDVGGPIDEARMTGNGSIIWYGRKPNCPDK
jgi:hypothetical protein